LNALLPYWRWVRLPRDRELDRALAELRLWLAGIISDTRMRMAADAACHTRPANFLEAMLAARDAEGRPFSEELIFGNAMTMLLAGEDTTANTLAWAVHELCDHPEALIRLHAEADAVLGDAGVAPDLETVGRLSFADAVAQETMRLRPVAPLFFGETTADVVLGDLALPRGTALFIATRPPGLDPARFADPRAFRPERWIDKGGGGAHDPAALVPFGSGPRICPGRTLALVELRLVLAMLAKTFDVERAEPTGSVEERFAFTMHPSAVRVRLRPRGSGAGNGSKRMTSGFAENGPA
jgi:cytochrome P450